MRRETIRSLCGQRIRRRSPLRRRESTMRTARDRRPEAGRRVDVLAPLDTADLDQLRRSFRGDVITPSHETYDEARRLWNSLVDRRPAVILRPTTADEVATAVRFGRDRGLEIAVRSGGHSHAG